jgi:hypothetical protein
MPTIINAQPSQCVHVVASCSTKYENRSDMTIVPLTMTGIAVLAGIGFDMPMLPNRYR